MEPAKYLFFIADNYCFEILRPLQRLIASEGGEVLWFVFGVNVHCGTFSDDDTYTKPDWNSNKCSNNCPGASSGPWHRDLLYGPVYGCESVVEHGRW